MDSSESESDSHRGRQGLGRGVGRRRRAMSSSGGEDSSPLGGFARGKRRRQSDDSIFGVFADGNDGGGREGKRRGGRGGGRLGTSPSAGVAFVRGETMKQIDIQRVAETQTSLDADADEIDPRFRFDGEAGPAKETAPSIQHGPNLPARNKLSFGQMSSNYGKGFAMLQKMGFTGGGLGKREDGIANPIEVVQRRGKMGLQDEGEMADQDLYGHEPTGSRRSVEVLLSNTAPTKIEPAAADGWKKVGGRAKRPRVTYRTAAEVAADAAVGGSEPAFRIVDMRGPEVRVATSFSELAASLGGDPVKSLKELRHNTRLLVARYEDKIRSLAENKRYHQEILLQVERDREQMKVASSMGPKEVGFCQEIVNKIENLRERQDEGTMDLASLGVAFGELRAAYPLEFKALRAFEVAVALAVPVARRELDSWRPLERPEEGLKHLEPWKKLADGEDPIGIYRLCDCAVMPRIRQALCEWSPSDVEPCVHLVECCRDALPSRVADAVTAEVVLPRLSAEVEAWDPRVDKLPIHLWIHPWLPHLGDRLTCLWTPIRFKLASCLERWEPRDRSAIEVIRPWSLVFDASNWEPLVERVLARLERAISDTPVKPDGQELGPVKDLLVWMDVLPLPGLARVLEVALFPQWHAALRTWLRSPECNYTEVLQWYQGWRTLLPPALRDQGGVQKQLANGLAVMKHCMSHRDDGPETVEEMEPPAPSVDRERTKAAATDTIPQTVVADDVNLSLCDYLAEMAGEQGLVFRPKGRTNALGREVYQFGAVSIYLDKNLVFVSTKDADHWRPVSFDEVFCLAKGSGTAAPAAPRRR